MPQNSSPAPGQDLSVPDHEHREYPTNLVAQAICEIRFPTLLELETDPPVAFQKVLRKEYPKYNRTVAVIPIIGSSEAEKSTGHVFTSNDKRWQVSLSSSRVSLDTKEYKSFDEFSDRLFWIMKEIDRLLDTPVYTRIGLRYINRLPVGVEKLSGWINPALCQPLLDGTFGRPFLYWQQMRGTCGQGSAFMFQHGLDPNKPEKQENYFLDSDFYIEDAEKETLRTMLSHFHQESYKLFEWAIADKAREHMNNPKAQEQRR